MAQDCCVQVFCGKGKHLEKQYRVTMDGNREQFPLSNPVTGEVTGISEPTTPPTSRSVAIGAAGAVDAQTVAGDESECFGGAMGSMVLQALSGMREFMQSMIEAMDRNAKTVTMVGNAVTDAPEAMPVPGESISRRSTAFPCGSPAARQFSGPGILQYQEPGTGQKVGPERKDDAGDSRKQAKSHDAEFEFYPSQIAFKIYSRSLDPVRVSQPGEAHLFAAQKAWKRISKTFRSALDTTVACWHVPFLAPRLLFLNISPLLTSIRMLMASGKPLIQVRYDAEERRSRGC